MYNNQMAIFDQKVNQQQIMNVVQNLGISIINTEKDLGKIDNYLMLTNRQKDTLKNCLRFANVFNCFKDNSETIISCAYNMLNSYIKSKSKI